jgi:hypothetical protein
VAATDVNADGLTLTFSDLAYLYRVIVGDAEPIWSKAGVSNDTVIVYQDTISQTVGVFYDDSLTLLFLTFSGYVDPVLADSGGPYIMLNHTESSTQMIISPGFETYAGVYQIDTGLLFAYDGDGVLTSAQAAYDGINPLAATVQVGQGSPCCLVRGNINHDQAGAIDVSDLVYFVAFMFDGGPPPPCPDEADVNVNGIVEIADLVWLVDYMFNFGPAPTPCP